MNAAIIQAQIDALLACPPCKTATDTRERAERIRTLRGMLTS